MDICNIKLIEKFICFLLLSFIYQCQSNIGNMYMKKEVIFRLISDIFSQDGRIKLK